MPLWQHVFFFAQHCSCGRITAGGTWAPERVVRRKSSVRVVIRKSSIAPLQQRLMLGDAENPVALRGCRTAIMARTCVTSRSRASVCAGGGLRESGTKLVKDAQRVGVEDGNIAMYWNYELVRKKTVTSGRCNTQQAWKVLAQRTHTQQAAARAIDELNCHTTKAPSGTAPPPAASSSASSPSATTLGSAAVTVLLASVAAALADSSTSPFGAPAARRRLK